MAASGQRSLSTAEHRDQCFLSQKLGLGVEGDHDGIQALQNFRALFSKELSRQNLVALVELIDGLLVVRS